MPSNLHQPDRLAPPAHLGGSGGDFFHDRQHHPDGETFLEDSVMDDVRATHPLLSGRSKIVLVLETGGDCTFVLTPHLEDPYVELLHHVALVDVQGPCRQHVSVLINVKRFVEVSYGSHCTLTNPDRSEERRVGKECRSRRSPSHRN